MFRGRFFGALHLVVTTTPLVFRRHIMYSIASVSRPVILLVVAGVLEAAHAQTHPYVMPPYIPVIPLLFGALALCVVCAMCAGIQQRKAHGEDIRARGVKTAATVVAKNVEHRTHGQNASTRYIAVARYNAMLPSGSITGVVNEFEVPATEHALLVEGSTQLDVVYRPDEPRHAMLQSAFEPVDDDDSTATNILCCLLWLLGVFLIVCLAVSIGIFTLVAAPDFYIALGITVGAGLILGCCCGLIGRSCGRRRARPASWGKLVPTGTVTHTDESCGTDSPAAATSVVGATAPPGPSAPKTLPAAASVSSDPAAAGGPAGP